MNTSSMAAQAAVNKEDTRCALKNQVEFLTEQLEKDQKELGSLLYKKFNARGKIIKSMSIITGASVAAGVISGFWTGNALYGLETGAVSTLLFNGFAFLFYLDIITSGKNIGGYQESTKYEKELLSAKSAMLSKLEDDENQTNKLSNDTFGELGLNFIKEGINLRYYFGANRKKVLGMYKEGILFEVLKSLDYSDAVIAEFMIYIEKNVRELENTKKEKKEKKYNKRLALQQKIYDFLNDF